MTVNPLHVKHIKELDDNSPTKNDVKDAKVIAQLVKDGRYAEPTIPQGVFVELRVAKKLRDLLNVDYKLCRDRYKTGLIDTFQSFLPFLKVGKGRQLFIY
nr:transposase [Bacillus weihaiensis]